MFTWLQPECLCLLMVAESLVVMSGNLPDNMARWPVVSEIATNYLFKIVWFAWSVITLHEPSAKKHPSLISKHSTQWVAAQLRFNEKGNMESFSVLLFDNYYRFEISRVPLGRSVIGK